MVLLPRCSEKEGPLQLATMAVSVTRPRGRHRQYHRQLPTAATTDRFQFGHVTEIGDSPWGKLTVSCSKIMTVAAHTYRTHSGTGVTNYSRARSAPLELQRTTPV